MDRPCRSSWTGAHEIFQAEEYDAGASPTQQASQHIKRRTAGETNPNFEMCFGIVAQVFNESFMKERLLYVVSDLEPYALV
jgi:hypothetical protein